MRKVVFVLLCAMVFSIPWEEMAVLPGAQSGLFTLGCATLALACATAIIRLQIRNPPAAYRIFALYIGWNFLSLSWAPDSLVAAGKSLTFLSLLLFAWMIWEFADREENILWLFRSYVLGCCVSLLMMLAAYAADPSSYDRYTGGGLNQNDLAIILDISIPLAAYLASRPSRGAAPHRKLYWAYITAAIIGVVLTGSRDGIITLGAGLAVMAVALGRQGYKAAAGLIVTACFALLIIPRDISEVIISRFAEGGEAHTFQLRVMFWKAGLEYWRGHPLIGCGVGNFMIAITPIAAHANVAHNTFISVLVEGGLIGFCLMAAAWALLARTILAMARNEKFLWLTILAIWIGGSMALSWEYSKSTWLIYACAMTHCAAQRGRRGLQAAEERA